MHPVPREQEVTFSLRISKKIGNGFGNLYGLTLAQHTT
ncbi:hypothetical protein EBME_1884 [bacterium endosymbiont of Mortierella elongata FMR23-6]|nr:hypothetical protein EBME_1884 [bacterium endosymbiont of Mortierella elongata FMR23-6]